MEFVFWTIIYNCLFHFFQFLSKFQYMPISWFPRNFTNPDLNYQDATMMRISEDSLYSVQLGLYVIGYKEAKDEEVFFAFCQFYFIIPIFKIKKFRPVHRVLCRLGTYANRNQFEYQWFAQKERINLNQVEQWYMNDWERMNDLYTYRVGYLKLAPLRSTEQIGVEPKLLSGF